MDTEYTEAPVCPHCGHNHRDAWEWDFGAGYEGDTEVECDMCDEPFQVFRDARITYTTKPLKEDFKTCSTWARTKCVLCKNEAVTAAAHEPVCMDCFELYSQEAAKYLPHHERTVFQQILNAGNARRQNLPLTHGGPAK